MLEQTCWQIVMSVRVHSMVTVTVLLRMAVTLMVNDSQICTMFTTFI